VAGCDVISKDSNLPRGFKGDPSPLVFFFFPNFILAVPSQKQFCQVPPEKQAVPVITVTISRRNVLSSGPAKFRCPLPTKFAVLRNHVRFFPTLRPSDGR